MTVLPARVQQFLVKRFGPRPLIGIVVAGVLFLLAVIFDDWVTSKALPYLTVAARQLLALPVGVFGLLFFVLLFAAVVIAFIDTSPTATRLSTWLERRRLSVSSPVPKVVLSAEERESVHRMRTLWNLKGERAAYRLFDLFAAVLNGLEGRLYWWDLLPRMREELQNTRVALTGAVGGDSQAPLTDVLDHFNRFFGAYARAVKWLALFEKHEQLRVAATYAELYQKWKTVDKEFRTELTNLHEWPEYKGKLKIFIENREVSHFLDPDAD